MWKCITVGRQRALTDSHIELTKKDLTLSSSVVNQGILELIED